VKPPDCRSGPSGQEVRFLRHPPSSPTIKKEKDMGAKKSGKKGKKPKNKSNKGEKSTTPPKTKT